MISSRGLDWSWWSSTVRSTRLSVAMTGRVRWRATSGKPRPSSGIDSSPASGYRACHAHRGARQSGRVRAQDHEEAHAEGWALQGDEEARVLREAVGQAQAEAGRGAQEAPQGHETGRGGRLSPPGPPGPVPPILG